MMWPANEAALVAAAGAANASAGALAEAAGGADAFAAAYARHSINGERECSHAFVHVRVFAFGVGRGGVG